MNLCGGDAGRVVVTAWVAVGCVGADGVACTAGLPPDEPQAAAEATVATAISASGNARIWSMRRISSPYLESDPWASVGLGGPETGSATTGCWIAPARSRVKPQRRVMRGGDTPFASVAGEGVEVCRSTACERVEVVGPCGA